MLQLSPFLLLVLAAFGTFMIVLLVVSLRCWGMAVPRSSEPAAAQASENPPVQRDAA